MGAKGRVSGLLGVLRPRAFGATLRLRAFGATLRLRAFGAMTVVGALILLISPGILAWGDGADDAPAESYIVKGHYLEDPAAAVGLQLEADRPARVSMVEVEVAPPIDRLLPAPGHELGLLGEREAILRVGGLQILRLALESEVALRGRP